MFKNHVAPYTESVPFSLIMDKEVMRMFHVKKSFSGDADHEILIIGIFDQGNKFGNWLQETDGHMQKQLIGMAKYGDLQAKKIMSPLYILSV